MAGRILPIALATVLGISIGVATFDGEFKEQRRRRLEEEYKREMAAAGSLQNESSPNSPSATPPTVPEQLSPKDEVKASGSASWSSMLGLWAWSKDSKNTTVSTTATTPPSKENSTDLKGKP